MPIQDIPPKPIKPTFGFTLDPELDAVAFVIGGDVYVTEAHETPLNEPVTFTAAGDLDDVLRYEWDFGDGSAGYGNPVVHTYAVASRQMQATLTLVFKDGTRRHISKRIYLAEA